MGLEMFSHIENLSNLPSLEMEMSGILGSRRFQHSVFMRCARERSRLLCCQLEG